MIQNLKGIVTEIYTRYLTIDVHGVGFIIMVPDEKLFFINQETKLEIYFNWNQESGPSLYGFTTSFEKQVFALIINCPGLGPKIGLAILSYMKPEQFIQAVTLADAKVLSNVNGIGTKKAEMIIMHLKDKINKLIPNTFDSIESENIIKIRDVSEALTSLNYSKTEISSALEYVKKQNDVINLPFDELLKKSLSFLSKRL